MAQVTFTSSTPIIIPVNGSATPYPSTISVAGYTGTITNIVVTLNGFIHPFVDDLGVSMSGPNGLGQWLFDGGPDGPTGGVPGGSPITVVFSAAGASQISPTDTQLAAGTYQPGLNEYNDTMPTPAPTTPSTSVNFGPYLGLTGSAVNGDYSLFFADFVSANPGGSLTGWSITITGITPVPEPTSLALLGIPAIGGMIWRRRRAKAAV
jgi:hypothetical protein